MAEIFNRQGEIIYQTAGSYQETLQHAVDIGVPLQGALLAYGHLSPLKVMVKANSTKDFSNIEAKEVTFIIESGWKSQTGHLNFSGANFIGGGLHSQDDGGLTPWFRKNLTHSSFRGATFTKFHIGQYEKLEQLQGFIRFHDCDFSETQWQESTLTGIYVNRGTFNHSQWHADCVLSDVIFNQTDFSDADWGNTRIEKTSLKNCGWSDLTLWPDYFQPAGRAVLLSASPQFNHAALPTASVLTPDEKNAIRQIAAIQSLDKLRELINSNQLPSSHFVEVALDAQEMRLQMILDGTIPQDERDISQGTSELLEIMQQQWLNPQRRNIPRRNM
ncbi:MAG: pentapeptide repeat-containing protein [Alphaproteobacteria bacterium]